MNQDMAKAIAVWWADFLRGGKRNEAHLKAFEEQSPKPGLLTRLMDVARESRLGDPVYLGSVDVFERELARLLVERPDEHTHRYGLHGYPESFMLDVDYDPQNFLDRALQLADLPRGCASGLPYKTTMRIDGDTAVVHMQGQAPVVVWPLATDEPTVDSAAETLRPSTES